MSHQKILANEFTTNENYIENIIKLLDEGNTIPFIARYRKEMHGAMDDQKIRAISERLTYLRNLDERREEIRILINEQGLLTEEIEAALNNANVLSELEDIYRPFRPKRKTRASVAKEKGLEPLADEIMENEGEALEILAEKYIDAEKGVETIEDAMGGANDIIAERISDDAECRKRIRNLVRLNGFVLAVGAKDDLGVYEMYKEFREKVSKIASHRVLAINRGEKEEFLKVSIEMEDEKPLNVINSLYKGKCEASDEFIKAAGEDAYLRLIYPAIEREIRSELTDTACASAIKLFGQNLRQLLMVPPVKDKTVIGLDPGFRTGCKVAVVDKTGKVLDTAVIYPTHSAAQIEASKQKLEMLIKKYNADILSIGNGTASRETEAFVAELIAEKGLKAQFIIVNEAGASVYSVSPLAAAEMPELDLTLRSAVSIARRLQDPLAELVKIEPKAIGVGQYQHDMPKKELENSLDGVVEDCVNKVGADLNTASATLLSHISGLSAAVCKNIVAYREENGEFSDRSELKKVAKLGPKAFEQSAGFLRIAGGKNPLDNTSVHPESYATAKALLKEYSLTLSSSNLVEVLSSLSENDIIATAEKLGVGTPTLRDIVAELIKPGRDPRDEAEKPVFKTGILGMDDLSVGMVLGGKVRNVIDFGAFVDIGVHQDGLVHISEISNSFIKHPSEKLSVGDTVKVKIIGLDTAKKRISLSIKQAD